MSDKDVLSLPSTLKVTASVTGRYPLESKGRNTIPTPSPTPPSVTRRQSTNFLAQVSRKSPLPTPPNSQPEVNNNKLKHIRNTTKTVLKHEDQENLADISNSNRQVKTSRKKTSTRPKSKTPSIGTRESSERRRSVSLARNAERSKSRASSVVSVARSKIAKTEALKNRPVKISATVPEDEDEDEMLLRGGADSRGWGEGKDWTKAIESRSMRSMSYVSSITNNHSASLQRIPYLSQSRQGSIQPFRQDIDNSFAEAYGGGAESEDEFDSIPRGQSPALPPRVKSRSPFFQSKQDFGNVSINVAAPIHPLSQSFGHSSEDEFDSIPRATSRVLSRSPAPVTTLTQSIPSAKSSLSNVPLVQSSIRPNPDPVSPQEVEVQTGPTNYTHFDSRSPSPDLSPGASELDFNRQPITDVPDIGTTNAREVNQNQETSQSQDQTKSNQNPHGGNDLDITFAIPSGSNNSEDKSFETSGPMQPEIYNTPIKGASNTFQTESPSPRRAFQSASLMARNKSRPAEQIVLHSGKPPMSVERKRKTPHSLRQVFAEEVERVYTSTPTVPTGLVPRQAISTQTESPINVSSPTSQRAGNEEKGTLSPPSQHDFSSSSNTTNSSISSKLRQVSSNNPVPVPTQRCEPPIIEISSTDPRAAARAAAILKVHHKYIEEGWTAASRNHDEQTFIEDPRDIPRDWESDLDDEELQDLLRNAEAEVSARLGKSGSKVRHKAIVQGAVSIKRPVVVDPTPKLPEVISHVRESSCILVDLDVWGRDEWRRLEQVYVRIRNKTDRQFIVDPGVVVKSFLKEEEVDEEECENAWAWDTLVNRVIAIRTRRTLARQSRSTSQSARSTMSPQTQMRNRVQLPRRKDDEVDEKEVEDVDDEEKLEDYDDEEKLEDYDDEEKSEGDQEEEEEVEEEGSRIQQEEFTGTTREIFDDHSVDDNENSGKVEEAKGENEIKNMGDDLHHPILLSTDSASPSLQSVRPQYHESTPDIQSIPPRQSATPSQRLFSFFGSLVGRPSPSTVASTSTSSFSSNQEIRFSGLEKAPLYPKLSDHSQIISYSGASGRLRGPLDVHSPRRSKNLPVQKYRPASLLAPLSGPSEVRSVQNLPEQKYQIDQRLMAPLPTRSPARNNVLKLERGKRRKVSGGLVSSLLSKLEKIEDSREEEQSRIEILKKRGELKRKPEVHDLRSQWHVPAVRTSKQSEAPDSWTTARGDAVKQDNGKRRKVTFLE